MATRRMVRDRVEIARFRLRIIAGPDAPRMIDSAGRRGQAGTVLVMTGSGLQGVAPDQIPAAHLYRALSALRATGQDYTARMIAAEALART